VTPETPPRVSVIICTVNRQHLLRGALESLAAQTLPRDEFELIIVDNASTPSEAVENRELAKQSCARYMFEDQPGVSVARNRGLEVARSPLVAFIDDDCRADPTWLQLLLEAYESHDGRPIAVGGPIRLEWPGEKPRWLPDSALSGLGQLVLGDAGLSLDGRDQTLFGGNLMMEKAFIRDAGGFRTDLGRRGSGLLGNEESALQRLLKARGGTIWYQPGAGVRHLVSKDRLNPGWFLRRAFFQGVSDVREGLLSEGSGSKWPSKSYVVRAFDRLAGLVVKHSLQEAMSFAMSVAYDFGRLSESIAKAMRRR